MTTTQHTTPTPVPEALRLAAWLTEGAWHKMTLGDVEAAGRELRRLHAIVASAPVAPTDENRALDLLAAMFDAYESGVQCYEDPEDQTGYLGHALQLDNDTFHACADLLNRRRPVKSTQAAPVAPAPQPAVPTIMRWHPLAGWGMHPAANGLYVRYEDHAAALAAAPKADHIADASKMVPAPLQQGEYLPLPQPDTHCYDEDTGKDVWSHSAEQMHAYLDAHLAARGAAQAAPDIVEELIRERDRRNEIIDALCDAVLEDRPEWSSGYYFEDVVVAVQERIAELEVRKECRDLNAQAAPAEQRNTKTHDLLSTMIGLFMGQRHKIGYKDNSVIAKVVAEAVEHLKDWPYPKAAPAPVAEDVEIRKALHDAATSLETISSIAGRDQYMLGMMDVRLYAAARAKVAREALAAQPEGGAK